MRYLLVAVLGLGISLAGPGQEPQKEPAKEAPDFQKDIAPIFEAKCNRCHGEKKKDGKLDMRTIPALLRGGVSGPAIAPGKADTSLLVELIHFNEMPPKKEKARVTKDELARIKAWIDAGAKESKDTKKTP
jgi:cytochrome c5